MGKVGSQRAYAKHRGVSHRAVPWRLGCGLSQPARPRGCRTRSAAERRLRGPWRALRCPYGPRSPAARPTGAASGHVAVPANPGALRTASRSRPRSPRSREAPKPAHKPLVESGTGSLLQPGSRLGAGGTQEPYRARDMVRTVRQIAALLIALGTLSGPEVSAQLPVRSLRLALGFGVDTTGSPAREVFDLWQRYLVESSDSVRAGLWSQAERATWHPFDLVSPYVYQGFSDYTVIRLAPAVGLPETYLITTLVSAVDDSTHAVRPLALYRVYATMEAGRWVLANALPRMTRTWRRETIGAITFVFPSAHVFDRRLARATATFADSLANA